SRFRVGLATKAFRLDILSFYFLLFTATLSTGLIERWFPIPASLLCGFLLWMSYFFTRENADAFRHLQPYSITLAVNEIEPVETWYRDKLNFVNGSSNILSKGGFSIEFEKVTSESPHGITRISFRVDDLNSVAKTLKEKSAEVVQEIRTDATSNIREFIIKDSNGTLLRFIED